MKNKYIEQIEEERRINKRKDLYEFKRKLVRRIREEEDYLLRKHKNGFDLIHVSSRSPFCRYKLAKEMYRKGYSIYYGTWGVRVKRYGKFKFLAWMHLKYQYIFESGEERIYI